jgi:hypothetical protein
MTVSNAAFCIYWFCMVITVNTASKGYFYCPYPESQPTKQTERGTLRTYSRRQHTNDPSIVLEGSTTDTHGDVVNNTAHVNTHIGTKH